MISNIVSTAAVIGYLAAALWTARLVADRAYRNSRKQWPGLRVAMVIEVAAPAFFAALAWPIVLAYLALTGPAKAFFVPSIAAEKEAKAARRERRERAKALRDSAKLLDDYELRRTLNDAAAELDKEL